MQTSTMFETRWQAPATCGELVQGSLKGRDFLVNCPIDLFSRASVKPHARPGVQLRSEKECGKIADALALAARWYGFDLRHELRLDSPIPRGKGMASSTADISAALEAVCRSCDRPLGCSDFARLITAIEPSDCVHVPGIAHVNHVTGEVLASFPPPSNLRVIVLDCGGEVDTVGFDRAHARTIYALNEDRIGGALLLLQSGLYRGDAGAVAEAATESARISQQILFKSQFEALLSCTRALGALGVNCAHSGTVLGVLYRGEPGLRDALLGGIEREFGADLAVVGDFAIIGGGCVAC